MHLERMICTTAISDLSAAIEQSGGPSWPKGSSRVFGGHLKETKTSSVNTCNVASTLPKGDKMKIYEGKVEQLIHFKEVLLSADVEVVL